MKRKICILLAAVVVIGTSIFVGAVSKYGNNTDALVDKNTLNGVDKAFHKDNINDVIRKSNIKNLVLSLKIKEFSGIKDTDDLTIGKPYKVIISSKELLNALFEDKPIDKILKQSSYKWQVPVLVKPDNLKPNGKKGYKIKDSDLSDEDLELCRTGTTCTIGQKPGTKKWRIESIGGPLSPKQIDLSRKSKALSTYLNDKSIKSADSFANIELSSVHMNLIYIKCQEKEYFIPLIHSIDKLYGLKNMQLYTRNEVVSAIEPNITLE